MRLALLCVFAGLAWSGALCAGGRLLATGVASPIEGGAGGGIEPWAVLAGTGTEDENGGSVFATALHLPDYDFRAYGAAFTLRNRVELSLARQDLELVTLGPALGLSNNHLRMDVFGVKARLFGDLIYGHGPQLSLGLQHKRQRDFLVPGLVGAKRDNDTDAYLAASRLFLGGAFGYNLALNGTVRYTRANQGGLLGFGGDQSTQKSLKTAFAGAVFFRPELALGLEWRNKPDKLSFAQEDRWRDVFLAWFPNKQLSVVTAYADLGSIAGLAKQRGWYLSVQLSP